MSAANPGVVELEVFSDVICPWCYIGKTKLAPAVEQYRATGAQVQVRLRPFLLQPDFQGESRPMMEYLTEKFGPRAAEMAEGSRRAGAEVGLELDSAHAIVAETRPAHRLIEAAWRHGGAEAQQRVADELFRSHFTLGEDIADADVLRTVAGRAELDPSVVEASFSDPAIAAEVEAGLTEAAQLGIGAVPTFVADRAIAVQGAQPTATLLALLEKAAEVAVG